MQCMCFCLGSSDTSNLRHRGWRWGLQLITALHRVGPANDYVVPLFWREHTRNFISADLSKKIKFLFILFNVMNRGGCRVILLVLDQTWNLSKNIHRRILRLKILHYQFHLISTVLVGKKHKKWEKMEKFTPLAKILHCRRQWRQWKIPPLCHIHVLF